MSRVKLIEPTVAPDNYVSGMATAFNWYNQEKDKKDARQYLRDYISHNLTKQDVKLFDKVPDSKIIQTYGWVSRMLMNGSLTLSNTHHIKFTEYIQNLINDTELYVEEQVVVEKAPRPSVRDNMKEKIIEYLGELEYALDLYFLNKQETNLYNDLKARSIPQPYCPFIREWIGVTAQEYINVYQTNDPDIKEGYGNIGRRQLTGVIRLLNQWLEDVTKYAQFKKANRKPRQKKVKPASTQIAKLKYKKEDTDLNIKSVSPVEIIGASQVWIYNTKYKKLQVYRTESATGILVKGTTLQNYEPDLCEQRALRDPKATIKAVLEASKVQLRRIMEGLTTKPSTVSGRIGEDSIILRTIK